MYCSKCGRSMKETQAFCPSCGKAAGRSLQGQAVEQSDQQRFDQSIRRVSRYWYLFAGLNVALGVAGLVLFDLHLTGLSQPWEPWPHPPGWSWTMAANIVWTLFASRVLLSLLAGWGLKEHAEWGRPVTLLAAAVSLLQFPIGVALAIYTFGVLFGKQHAALYEHWAGAK